MLWYTNRYCLFLLSVIREMDPFVEGNQLHKLLRNKSFCLITRIWGDGVSCGPAKINDHAGRESHRLSGFLLPKNINNFILYFGIFKGQSCVIGSGRPCLELRDHKEGLGANF